jgi:hypothetical protein
MKRMKRHVRLVVIAIGLATYLGAAIWSATSTGPISAPTSVGEIAAVAGFLLFEMTPFLALAVIARRLSWWLTLAVALGFSALTLETAREMNDSTSSTASLALIIVPIALLMAVPILLALSEGVRVIRSRQAGGAIAKPGWRYVVLGLVLGAIGFLTLFIFGLVAGLALTFAIWAKRSARATSTGTLPEL